MGRLRIISLLFLLTLTGNILSTPAQSLPQVNKGSIDLKSWNSEEHPVIKLNGEWKFYWNQLLTANDLPDRAFEYAQVSVPWNEQAIKGQQYPRNGFATYVLEIHLPDHIKTFSFWMPAVFNTWSLSVNDSTVAGAGIVGKDEQSTTPLWKPEVVNISVTDPTVFICLQIANFQGTRGGCAEIPQMSKEPYLTDRYTQYLFTGKALVLLFGIVLLGGVVVYAASGVNSYLAIGFVAGGFIIRFLFSDLYLVYELTGTIPWHVTIKLEYSSIPIIILTATYFLRLIYPNEFSKLTATVFTWLSYLALGGILLLPTHLLSEVLIALQLVGLTFALVILVAILRALRKQRRGAWLTAISFFCFASVGFYNIYTFLFLLDLNRTIIHVGYAVALVLSVVSLSLRTPMRLREEALEMLTYEDLYKK